MQVRARACCRRRRARSRRIIQTHHARAHNQKHPTSTHALDTRSRHTQGDGTGALSIYGTRFADENFTARHTGTGLLSAANSGPDSNGCQFFVTCAAADWLDRKHVVFGRVLGDGLLVVRKIENVATGPANRPKMPVVIAECGEM